MSNEDIGQEQEYLSNLYRHLDDMRRETSGRLGATLRESDRRPGARFERDAAGARHARTLLRLNAAEHGLCFGRLDFDGGERRYIGRIGILDEQADYEPLLVDWRAPAARPYYVATAASRLDVWRRRRILTRRRTVVGVDDDVFDLEHPAGDGPGGELVGEAALFAALNAARTGRMSDVVETIQTEQDSIIRSDHRGVLIVQGGPGTGKTAVALHRAAYLLYTYRERLERAGVLIVGPNTTFLRYISDVLPSLGETSVVTATVAGLHPGVEATGVDAPAAAEVKGRASMADAILAAVRDRQRLPRENVLAINTEERLLLLERSTCRAARSLARDSREPHNTARTIFVEAVIDALARQVADGYAAETITADVLEAEPEAAELLAPVGTSPLSLLDEEDLAQLRRELRADPDVQRALDELWPVLTPRRLLADLWADPAALSSAAPDLTAAERELLRRDGADDPAGGWTPADIPLLDEAAELLGEDDLAERAARMKERRDRVAYAQGVLDIMARDLDDDPDILMASDLIDAGRFADRQEETDERTIAQRALADRTWTFGHVIVDEAQELSAMAWRMVMRRCPSRWMTVVGDVAQTGDPAGASSWEQVLAPYRPAVRSRLATLTLNYRTPAEVMAVAADVLATLDPPGQAPRSVRETGVEPWRVRVPGDEELGPVLARLAAEEATRLGDSGAGAGRVAVIVPDSRVGELEPLVRAAVPEAGDLDGGGGPDGADPEAGPERRVAVLGVRRAKGLEFDAVLVADPARILAESARGAGDLYVALTRATKTLGVVHAGDLPPVLRRLRERAPVG